MKLKSFGCSFIYGSDLADEKTRPHEHRASELTWTALMAKQFGLQYECFAKAGCGNLRILERIIQQSCISDKNDLFVIGWSWIDRFDYYDIYDSKQYHYSNWKTVLPKQETTQSDIYYRNFHAQYKDKFTTLLYIRAAIDTLNQKQIPFIMTNIDNLIFETEWHVADAVLDLQKYVGPWITSFNNKTFLEWSQENKFPISDANHPLEQAHREAADLISNKIQQSKLPDRLIYSKSY
jgi:hypothetical protein